MHLIQIFIAPEAATRGSYEFWEIFKNTFFIERLRTTASVALALIISFAIYC